MALEGEAALEFHAYVNGGGFDQLYLRASERYQHSISAETNRQFYGRLVAAMGQCSASRRVNLVVNRGTGGTFLTARRVTKCANGVLDETFIWEINNGVLKLVKYAPNSPLLLSKYLKEN